MKPTLKKSRPREVMVQCVHRQYWRNTGPGPSLSSFPHTWNHLTLDICQAAVLHTCHSLHINIKICKTGVKSLDKSQEQHLELSIKECCVAKVLMAQSIHYVEKHRHQDPESQGNVEKSDSISTGFESPLTLVSDYQHSWHFGPDNSSWGVRGVLSSALQNV